MNFYLQVFIYCVYCVVYIYHIVGTMHLNFIVINLLDVLMQMLIIFISYDYIFFLMRIFNEVIIHVVVCSVDVGLQVAPNACRHPSP